MTSHGFRGVANLAQIELLGHRHECDVDRAAGCRHDGHRSCVTTGVISRLVSRILDPGTAIAFRRKAFELALVTIDDFVEAVTGLQPVGQRVDLVGRSGGESGRSTVRLVRRVVDGRCRCATALLGLIEVLVLSHDEDAPGADLGGDRRGTELETGLLFRSLGLQLRLGIVLLIQVDRRVDVVASTIPVALAFVGVGAENLEVIDLLGDVVAEGPGVAGVGATARRGAELDVVLDGCCHGFVVLDLSDHLQLEHDVEDVVATARVRRVLLRVSEIAVVGQLHDGDEARGLDERDVGRALAEILLRR